MLVFFFFKQKTAYEIRISTGVQTCALPISSSSTGFSSAYVAFVLPAVIGLKQNVGRLVSGLGQQGRDLREGARDIGSRSPRLDVFQFIVISDTRDLHPGSVGGLGEGLDLHHLPPREADVRTAEKAVRAFSYDLLAGGGWRVAEIVGRLSLS